MITYYEVTIDGEMLAHRGKLWEGMGEPGHILQRPSRVGKRKDTTITALDTDLAPGLHEVAVGFAVTWVEDDANANEYGKYNQEFYVNRGVRAVAADDEHEGEWGTKLDSSRFEVCTDIVNTDMERIYKIENPNSK